MPLHKSVVRKRLLRKSPLRTQALLSANRANALFSTGPRTSRGKHPSALRAWRRGGGARLGTCWIPRTGRKGDAFSRFEAPLRDVIPPLAGEGEQALFRQALERTKPECLTKQASFENDPHWHAPGPSFQRLRVDGAESDETAIGTDVPDELSAAGARVPFDSARDPFATGNGLAADRGESTNEAGMFKKRRGLQKWSPTVREGPQDQRQPPELASPGDLQGGRHLRPTRSCSDPRLRTCDQSSGSVVAPSATSSLSAVMKGDNNGP